MDINMPDMDGHEASKLILEIIKNTSDKGTAKIIAVSNFDV